MKTARFSLADLLTLIAAVAFGFICFLGLNFLSEGAVELSIAIAVGITIVLGGLALLIKLQKKVMSNFKMHIILEGSLLVVFTILFFAISYLLFPHYFNVSDRKEKITETLLESISGAEKMFDSYEAYAQNRESVYKLNLNSVVAAKNTRPNDYASFGFGAAGISDRVQIENKLFTLHADLFPTNYADTVSKMGTKDIALRWLSEQRSVVSEWKPIGVPIVANEIAAKAENWKQELIGYSHIREKGEEAEDFSFQLSFGNVSSYLTDVESPTIIPILLSIALWAMMLFSWLITKRGTRFPGFKRVFGREKKLDNEL